MNTPNIKNRVQVKFMPWRTLRDPLVGVLGFGVVIGLSDKTSPRQIVELEIIMKTAFRGMNDV